METKFDLAFSERDDGTKVWAAWCRECGVMLVGERYPPVTVVRLAPGAAPVSASEFEAVKTRVCAAWETARKTGNPIVIADNRFVIAPVIDHGDLQRALEGHADKCSRTQSGPVSLPVAGPGSPL